ncbi:U4/U5/U6 small nuclear ribonucleoprotein-like protein [Emericellopsis cladophorae]|uniref:U4/U5/U6 small nuclear ribonucleoprotein-like protein n=1 Tax=Emericellopsis cladophorae TaxID=2686198 RepID=A0A9Q0BF69_9HYPO|nr:U4/U5/U6 small nuclear ribonucleoprotein-like protein [Emericellopsis cladophorae]KAI6781984.1 U4/U5/U6 small nuclear ribonucleoprotein-like protein [Emericellopsis cladophorae]
MERSQQDRLGPRHDGTSRIQKSESAAERLAALKARVSAAIDTSKAKGGLNVGLHPALEDLGSWKPATKGKDAAKPSSLHKNDAYRTLNDPRAQSPGILGADGKNPYLDTKASSQHNVGKPRESRQLIFNQKGKYIQQGAALRRQAALEAMKKRIAEQTRKAGIDDDLDVEKNFVVDAPPDIEWWDEGLVNGSNYDDIENSYNLKINSPDSIITEYIQHPVQLQPAQDKQAPREATLYLTSKEQAKIRRQRRMAELKEKQTKIGLGLVPAPPDKVKKGNLMRVLGDVAVKDPTAVEARVNREIAERHQQHVDMNEERKLSKEQRHEKLKSKQEKDAGKGIHVLVFKINSLANGQHRYKIGVNAEQLNLTGTCIMHPKFNLVVVEGGEHSANKFKKLMLNRIDWTENSPSREKDGNRGVVRDWLLAENERGELKDMSLNECKLVFDGEEKDRGFSKWGSRVCENDAEARDVLSRAKMENFWSLAKAFT